MRKFILLAFLIVFGLRSGAQTASLSLLTPPCDSNGVIVATFTGLTPPYTVYWHAPSFSAHTVSSGTTDTLYGFTGGFVEIYTSGGGTSVSDTATYAPAFTVTTTVTNAVCPALGSLDATVTGGTGPFTYQWISTPSYAVVSTSNPAAVPVGNYIVRVTDASTGCVAGFNSDSLYVANVPDFTAVVNTTIASCTNGTATAVITGGTAPFSYVWSTGATTSSVSGLIMGYYNVTITDALGCTSYPVYGYVSQSITIDVYDTPTPATCVASDGSIIAFGSGGTPPYTYLWSNGGTTQSITGLVSNYYDVTATDANGCIGTGGDYVGSSTPITVTDVTTPSSCTSPTGSATLTVGGGTTPYSITWYTTPAESGPTATSLPSGNYYFGISDAVGCVQSGSVYIPPVDVINLSFSTSPATCLASDGAISVYASGGVAPYSYLWSGGSTGTSLTGIPSGGYEATVTDAHGCTVSYGGYVPFSSPLELGVSTTPASCLYNSDGTLTAAAALGTPPYAYSMGGSSSSPVTTTGLPTGPYWVYVTDAMGCTAYNYAYVGYDASNTSCYCVVSGTVYDDINHNCIQDPGEPGIDHIQMQCSGLGYTYTDASGYYSFLMPAGSTVLSETILDMYPLSPCQPNNIAYTSIPGTGCAVTYNFADTVTTIHDTHISTWDYTFARPGFPYTQAVVITNDGTVTEPAIIAGYKPDGQVYAPSFVPFGDFTGSPYYYGSTSLFPSLAPGAGQDFHVNYNVPADLPLGTNVTFKDSVSYMAPMTNWLNDYSPWNNTNYFTTTTVGSYDPNFKEVSPKGTGPTGMITTNDSILEYMVHFQNTGTYLAENVVVKDTLSPNLDWASLKPVFMSNKGVVSINDSGVVTFTFKDIELPPASSEPVTSNAMFTYTIKQRPGLAVGTQIKNKASIYFDYNAPIVTKNTLNTIGATTSVPSTPAATAGINTFTVYPNPAQNTFNAAITISSTGDYDLTVSDITGKTAISKKLTLQAGSQNVTVDVASLVPGVYFVTFSGNEKIAQTQKLVIMK